MTTDLALQIIQDCFDSLHSSGLILEKIQINSDTVIIGLGSQLDSISFVTMITELEDKLNEASSKDIFFVLDEIQDFDINNPFLSANSFAQYMLKLVN